MDKSKAISFIETAPSYARLREYSWFRKFLRAVIMIIML